MKLKDKLKGALKSWTIWVNGAFAALAVFLPQALEALPGLAPHLPASTYQGLMVGLTVANLLLRFKTTKSLAEK